MMNDSLSRIIASELQARAEQVDAAIRLLDEGNTVPFIARYRKEVTGGLDDTQLRQLETRLGYLRELEERRAAILKSIADQGKLTDELQAAITGTQSKTELEDLYLPYKPKRRTRGQIAIEAGLEPLADLLWNEPSHDPEAEAAKFINADNGVADTKAALDGARYILMERFAEDAALLAKVRDYLWKNAHLVSTVVPGKEEEGGFKAEKGVREDFQPHDTIDLFAFRGDHDDRHRVALAAQTAADRKPVFTRKHQIKHHQVEGLAGQQAVHLFGVCHAAHLEALLGEVTLKQRAQAHIVIHHQNLVIFLHCVYSQRLKQL
ncbi:Transcription accessory protein (S1 RNA-binding domain) [Cronobacter malonaticus 681]|nr:Transcription accessory protein (S1 RNA-binding domain) [Cronobacter malonaticus 681]